MIQLPRNICLNLRHNPYAGDYILLETWLESYLLAAEAGGTPRDEVILPAAARATGEVWRLSWCPDTPVGSCTVVAATLDRAIELAGPVGEGAPHTSLG